MTELASAPGGDRPAGLTAGPGTGARAEAGERGAGSDFDRSGRGPEGLITAAANG
jgi:hypothetical protein